MAFNKNESVVVKGGGPYPLTVVGYNSNGNVDCEHWDDSQKKMIPCSFPEDRLDKDVPIIVLSREKPLNW